jgi:hypothetical protein
MLSNKYSAVKQREYRARHPDRAKASSAKWYAKKGKEYGRKHTQEYRSRKRAARTSRPMPPLCEVCARPSARRLCWDHDHKTGKFRGWLCNKCNTALGQVDDNSTILSALINYLRVSDGDNQSKAN